MSQRYHGTLQPPYQPQIVDAIRAAFPDDVADLMPSGDDIPQDFFRNRGEARRWVEFQRAWFYRGVDTSDMVAKPGVDKWTALRHLHTIQGSFSPPHQYKEAAVAWLASVWFDNPPGGE